MFTMAVENVEGIDSHGSNSEAVTTAFIAVAIKLENLEESRSGLERTG